MSDSKKPSSQKLGRVSMALAGLVIVFLIFLVLNYVASIGSFRVDLTENNIFTLSDGTKKILGRLDTPVVLRYYVSPDLLSPAEKAYSQRVEDLLNEYRRAAKGKLTLQKFDPEPNTDAEDSAMLDGLQRGLSRESGNEIFLGVSVECVDEKETLPFLPSRPETLLEYDLSRAIARVHDGAGSMVRIMTTMQIGGGFGGNFNAPPSPAWYLVESLRRDYQVEFLPMSADEIPAGTDVLMVLHPYDITEAGQYAIDQYLLKGGKVVAVVDPSFFASRFMGQGNPMMGAAGGPGPSSNLDKLFAAWGVGFNPDRVVADMVYQTQIREGYSPTVLSLAEEAINRGDPVTQRLNDIFLINPGALEVTAKEGITAETLLQSSPTNSLVSSMEADPTQRELIENLRKNFKPSGKAEALAIRLSGNFATAFPDGNPAAKADAPADGAEPKDPAAAEVEKEQAEADGEKPADDGKKEEPPPPPADNSLKKSEKEGVVVVFADADFLYDEFCVQRQSVLGQTMVMPLNSNVTLMENAIEMLSGDPELINIRSRVSNRRPFTKLNEWLQEAEAKFQDKLKEFETEARDAESKINEILSQKPDNVEETLMSPAVQTELHKLRQQQAEVNKTVRELNKEMKRDFDLAQLRIKLLCTAAVPILVVCFGIGLALQRRMKTAAR
ncbi:MAG: GldG family protein [Akkermansiaceae bacterium]|nr:GldG family protein [Akkermansiaceae bacterium]MCP5550894.1 GldG family protein [Akkermansiaceae bacterium]